ncbi:MAG: hypothetical protein LPK88_10040 [Alphaproteobacteria bacterium]|nr:hypothetical protein [Alphaproteobacteria bacterium]MDX5416638.1 hypothetical protein [Alphaproteobacteria bacterium]MDX5494010.1 hypothetical protein [Alphaproteobacteria bacterium]
MSGTVIAIWLGAGGAAHARAELAAIRVEHPGACLILLTTPRGRREAGEMADTCWEDAAARGASGFLARARRLSWASPSHIHDLEASPMTRFLRFCVWPRPQWRARAPKSPDRQGSPRFS